MDPNPEGVLNVGLVGCGRIAQSHLEVLPRLKEAQVTAVCDVDSDLAACTAEEQGCRNYCNLQDMLERETLDAVFVCAPPAHHAEIAITCLERGLHVLCEKPLALNSDESVRMYRAAKRANRVLSLASKFRHMPTMIKAKAQIKAGLIGQPILYFNRFAGRVDMAGRWNSVPSVSGGGVLIDNGTHSVDVARYLLGPVTRVAAHAPCSLQGLDVEDTVVLSFECGQTAGSIQLTWSLDNLYDPFVRIEGTEGVLQVGWKESSYRLYRSQEWIPFGEPYNKLVVLENQDRHFLECVQGKVEPLIDVQDGLQSVRVIEAAYEALHTGRWITVDENAL